MPDFKHDKDETNPFNIYKANTQIGLYIRLNLLKTMLVNNERLNSKQNQKGLQSHIDCNGTHITLFVRCNLIKKIQGVYYWVGPQLVPNAMILFIIKEVKASKKGKKK